MIFPLSSAKKTILQETLFRVSDWCIGWGGRTAALYVGIAYGAVSALVTMLQFADLRIAADFNK